MASKNKTRDGTLAQKKGLCVAVIPFVEADILDDGSVYVNLPKRSVITRINSNIIVDSTTASASLTVLANNNAVITNMLVYAIVGVKDEFLQSSAQYLKTGGKLVIKAGSVPPATGSLVGELIVEYIELDKNTGEYTTYLKS